MVYPGYNFYILTKVIVLFTIFYIWLPNAIFKPRAWNPSGLDKVFMGLTHSSLLAILSVYFLVYVKLYETFSLIALWVAAGFMLKWVLGVPPLRNLFNLKIRITALVMDLNDGEKAIHLLERVRDKGRHWKEHTGQWLIRAVRNPFAWLIPLAVVALAFIKLYYPFVHAGLLRTYFTDLSLIRLLGNNQMYLNGIKPLGFYAVVSNMTKLTLIEPYWLLRYLIPFFSLLQVLSVYYFTRRATGEPKFALVSLVLYGFVFHDSLWLNAMKQIGSLPMEFGAIFVLPGLYFLWNYVITRRFFLLVLFAEALMVAAFSSFITALYLSVLAMILTLGFLFYKKADIKILKKVIVSITLALLAALIPVGAGLLAGDGINLDFASGVGYIPAQVCAVVVAVVLTIIQNQAKNAVASKAKLKKISGVVLGVLCVGLIGWTLTEKIPEKTNLNDITVENYMAIVRNFPFYDWVIVSQTSEMQLASESGLYYDVPRFMEAFPIEKVGSPKFRLPFDRHLFLFVEKIPIPLDKNSSLVLADGVNKNAAQWAAAYGKSHRNSDIFYEDIALTVYHFYPN